MQFLLQLLPDRTETQHRQDRDRRDIRALAKIWGNSEDAYAAYLRTRYGERPPNSVSAEDAEVGVALAVLCGGGSRR